VNAGRAPGVSAGAVRVNSLLRGLLYRSRFATRLVYGIWATPFGHMSFWELGTLVMRQALRAELRAGMRVLEIGTGPHALLGLWAARRNAVVTAADINADYLQHATGTAARNQLRVQLLHSDLLTAVDGKFDLIWFVPPHTSAATLRLEIDVLGMRGADEIAEFTGHACGGEAGWEIIARYLEQSRRHLAPGGRVLVAVNCAHVGADTLDSLAAAAGLEPRRSVALPVAPHRAFVFC
jgi:methylase of polypeptide subunit release factors